jgi:hypothetical protein
MRSEGFSLDYSKEQIKRKTELRKNGRDKSDRGLVELIKEL